MNVNGIWAVKKRGFIDWVRQETKAHPDQLSPDLKDPADKDGKAYRSYWASARKKVIPERLFIVKPNPWI